MYEELLELGNIMWAISKMKDILNLSSSYMSSEDTNEPRKIKIIDFAKDWIRNNVTSNPPHVLIQR